jgi:hypothetical protein
MSTGSPILIKWLSPHTVAQRWGVCTETVLRLVRTGALDAHQINKRVFRISEVDAAAYFTAHRVSGRPKKAQLAQLATSGGG